MAQITLLSIGVVNVSVIVIVLVVNTLCFSVCFFNPSAFFHSLSFFTLPLGLLQNKVVGWQNIGVCDKCLNVLQKERPVFRLK